MTLQLEIKSHIQNEANLGIKNLMQNEANLAIKNFSQNVADLEIKKKVFRRAVATGRKRDIKKIPLPKSKV